MSQKPTKAELTSVQTALAKAVERLDKVAKPADLLAAYNLVRDAEARLRTLAKNYYEETVDDA